MKWYYKIRGGHTHVRVFMNGAKCGDLCFRNEEFQQITGCGRPEAMSSMGSSMYVALQNEDESTVDPVPEGVPAHTRAIITITTRRSDEPGIDSIVDASLEMQPIAEPKKSQISRGQRAAIKIMDALAVWGSAAGELREDWKQHYKPEH